MQTFSDIIKSRAQPVEKKGRFKVQKVDEDKRLLWMGRHAEQPTVPQCFSTLAD
mgnify:CR=1 FL=1